MFRTLILRSIPRTRRIRRMMDMLAEREKWSPSEIAEFQLEKINQIWDHAITHVPYYRQLLQKMNLPRQFKTLSEYTSSVPILDKEVVRSGQLVSERRRPGKWHRTSGSTGIPLAIYRENDAELEMLACQYRMRALWGVNMSDKMVLLVHLPPISPSLSGLTHVLSDSVKNFLLQRTRLAPYQLGKDYLRRYLQKIRDLEPRLIYGNCSSIYPLALEAMETGVTLDSLRLVVMTMEIVSDSMLAKVEKAFHTDVITEYGAEECYVIAYGGGRRPLRVNEDQVLVETLPTGDNFYRVVISVLGNPSFPLLRYDIGDLTDKPIHQVDSGFSALGHVIGRSADHLMSGRGHQVRGFPLVDFLEVDPSIRRIRAHQFSDGKVLVLLEVDSIASRVPVNAIQKKLVRFLEGQNVEVRLVESLPKTGNKHKWITSDLKKSQPS